MHKYEWDPETGGLLLSPQQEKSSKEPRPVYYREMNLLGMDQRWHYPQNDDAPIMWAEAEKYIYRGRMVARAKGGSLYTAPEIIYTEDDMGEPVGTELVPVDIAQMVEKNQELMTALTEYTSKKLYNEAFIAYQDKVDLFYVAFSGGKDSVVALDVVQRTLPHDSFVVVFGDTGMEFPDTYEAAQKVREICKEDGIKFLITKSDHCPLDNWKEFGPPATTTRWCCSVHKTAPQIIALRELLHQPDFCGMAIVGVRADESAARSKYEYISLGEKHKGQYSCNVILDWSSAEIYLYSYMHNLVFNETYKKGNRRAGCLICPRAAERNDFMSRYWYSEDAEKLIDAIRFTYRDAFPSTERLEQFIANGGWKARKNGRDLSIPLGYEELREKDDTLVIKVSEPKTDWHTWIKTIGIIEYQDGDNYRVKFHTVIHSFTVVDDGASLLVRIGADETKDTDFIKLIKHVFRKAACCIGCRECQADCPYGCLSFKEGKVIVSENCHHCAQCHKPEKGCLVYKSLERPKGGSSVNKKESLNSYSHFAPKMDWIEQYFMYKNDFKTSHNLGSVMYDFYIKFLRHAELLDGNEFTTTAQKIDELGLINQMGWGIMLVNLAYNSRQVEWVSSLPFDTNFTKDEIAMKLVEEGAKESWTNDIFASMTRLGELPFGEMGFGKITKVKREAWFERSPWLTPISEVVLYALYKFAEKCGGYYQFTLTYLMDETIEREGVSPTSIFGLDQDTMIKILNGLAINYPDFITVSFHFGLDTISLNKEKKAADIIELL